MEEQFYYFCLNRQNLPKAYVRYKGKDYNEALGKIKKDFKDKKDFWAIWLSDLNRKPYRIKHESVWNFWYVPNIQEKIDWFKNNDLKKA